MRGFDYEVAYKDDIYEPRLIFTMVIIIMHVYPNSFRVLFPWKLADMLHCMGTNIASIIFALGPTPLVLIYKELEDI